jgi:periplasmic protein TonB
MKRVILIIYMIFYGFIGYSQIDDHDTIIYTIVDVMPQFSEDETALTMFIYSNLRAPDINCFVTKIIFSFIIEKDGSLSQKMVTIDENSILMMENGSDSECKKAWMDSSIELLNKMPKWKAGIQNGKQVRVRYTIPLRLDP